MEYQKKHLVKVQDIQVLYRNEVIAGNTKPCIHCHDGYEIGFYISADVDCFIKNMEYKVNNNSILFIQPYQMHTIKYKDGLKYHRYVVNFKETFILPCLEAMGISDILQDIQNARYQKINLNIEASAKLNNVMVIMFRIYTEYSKTNDAVNLAKLKSYLCILLLEIAPAYKGIDYSIALSTPEKLVYNIIAYIDEQYSREINLQLLTEMFFIDRFYACHIFKKITSVSIIEYIQYRRVLEAQKLLLSTDKPILEICYDCGFNNIQHFYRIFKRLTNKTPARYRISN